MTRIQSINPGPDTQMTPIAIVPCCGKFPDFLKCLTITHYVECDVPGKHFEKVS